MSGRPGGVYNFWFRAAAPRGSEAAGRARTLFVDKSAPTGGNGSLGQPYNNIGTALANAREFDILRIVGNAGADGNVATLGDNLAYRIGFDDFHDTGIFTWSYLRELGEKGAELFAGYERDLAEKGMSRDMSEKPR